MAILTRGHLQNLGRKAYYRKSVASMTDITVFLSHSHKDKDLVEGIANLLAGVGVEVYIDWLDDGMPERPDRETAKRIKDKIKEYQRFVLLATKNSLNSLWVPWELGLADGVKEMNKIAVLPVRDDSYESWKGNEHIDLYPRIEDTGVFHLGATWGATQLSTWLEKGL